MKILICGSRDWDDTSIIQDRLEQLPRDTEILHGNAPGADRIAAAIALMLGLSVTSFPANWKRYGKSAGLKRNIEMLDENPDLVIAFQKNKSRGTQHTIDNAIARGIQLEIFSERNT